MSWHENKVKFDHTETVHGMTYYVHVCDRCGNEIREDEYAHRDAERWNRGEPKCERCDEVNNVVPRGVDFDLLSYIEDVANRAARKAVEDDKGWVE